MIVVLLFMMNSLSLLLFSVYLWTLLVVSLVWQWTSLQNSKLAIRRVKKYAKFIDLKHERIIITFIRYDEWVNEWKLTFVILIILGFLCILFARKFSSLELNQFPPIGSRLQSSINRAVKIGLLGNVCILLSFGSYKCCTINVSLLVSFPMFVFWEFHLDVTSFCTCLTCTAHTFLLLKCCVLHIDALFPLFLSRTLNWCAF